MCYMFKFHLLFVKDLFPIVDVITTVSSRNLDPMSNINLNLDPMSNINLNLHPMSSITFAFACLFYSGN